MITDNPTIMAHIDFLGFKKKHILSLSSVKRQARVDVSVSRDIESLCKNWENRAHNYYEGLDIIKWVTKSSDMDKLSKNCDIDILFANSCYYGNVKLARYLIDNIENMYLLFSFSAISNLLSITKLKSNHIAILKLIKCRLLDRNSDNALGTIYHLINNHKDSPSYGQVCAILMAKKSSVRSSNPANPENFANPTRSMTLGIEADPNF
jgi:hypothetical protein